ncbi:hypothetical protein A2J03_24175 [Rhodococcus sp. EPR-157]|uniref:hypothetical protein n=1 Tax=Rhodococcus sp. EPR-157 TaxID=1813677 RepID=UPI0007BC5D35|nr:hypothetical protein [Rhodococcus sp. EPR-157]KZF06653.1 hypothetical protein A2J03_24175 [Rhodococcus sp. EPR-157]
MPPQSANTDWATSGWWVGRELDRGRFAEESISRNQLIALWVRETAEPKPNVKHLAEDLAAWMGTLGSAEWVAQRFSSEASRRLRLGTNEVLGGVDVWDLVSAVAVEYGDTLARCSAGVVADVRLERPVGLPARIAQVLRKYEDGPPRTAARHAMVNSEACGTVVKSRNHADRYIDNPNRYRSAIVAASMRSYNGKLTEYRERIDDSSDDKVSDSIAAAIERLTELYGEADVSDRLPAEHEISYVEDKLDRFLTGASSSRFRSDLPLLEGSTLYTTADVRGEAWRRARRNLLRLHMDSVELDENTITEVYGSNFARARQDLQRALIRESARKSASELDTAHLELGYRSTETKTLFSQASSYLAQTPIESDNAWSWKWDGRAMCWERAIALEILADAGSVAGHGASALEQTLRERYDQVRPSDTLAPTRTASITLALQLTRGALASVIHDDDVFGNDGVDLVGSRKPGQTWAEKTADVLSALRGHRVAWDRLTGKAV